jgi:uncharacterized protein
MLRSEVLSRLDNLTHQLVERYAPEKVILFGSAAWGDSEINDVDLFIIKSDVPLTGAERIRELYRLLDVDLPVDYIVYRPDELKARLKMGDPFVERIVRDGKVLHG